MNRFRGLVPFPWLGYLPLLDADAGGGSGDAGQGGDASHSSNSGDAGGDEGKQGQSQADIDKIVTQRLARAKKQWEADAKAEHDKAAMSEAERLKAEKADAEKRASERETAANQRVIRAEARVQAVALGIKPERVTTALKLADLSEVTVGDDGEPESEAIKKALEAVLKELPELKGEAAASRSGGQFNGHQAGKTDISKLSRDEFDKLQKRVMSGERITL